MSKPPDVPRMIFYESADDSTVRVEEVVELYGGAILGCVVHTRRRATALLYMHGIESHVGWFDGPGDKLAARGYDVYCLDRRGSGINGPDRGFAAGDIDAAETLVYDAHELARQLRQRYDKVFLVGLSWGGKLAMAHALAHPDDCEGVVLITPGLVPKIDLTMRQKAETALDELVHPRHRIPVPIEPPMFTTTPEILAKIEDDPMRLHAATARFFWQTHRIDRYIAAHIEDNERPIQLFLAGHDRIVDNDRTRALLERGAQDLTVVCYEDQTHSIQFDAPDRLVADMTTWLTERGAPPPV